MRAILLDVDRLRSASIERMLRDLGHTVVVAHRYEVEADWFDARYSVIVLGWRDNLADLTKILRKVYSNAKRGPLALPLLVLGVRTQEDHAACLNAGATVCAWPCDWSLLQANLLGIERRWRLPEIVVLPVRKKGNKRSKNSLRMSVLKKISAEIIPFPTQRRKR